MIGFMAKVCVVLWTAVLLLSLLTGNPNPVVGGSIAVTVVMATVGLAERWLDGPGSDG